MIYNNPPAFGFLWTDRKDADAVRQHVRTEAPAALAAVERAAGLHLQSKAIDLLRSTVDRTSQTMVAAAATRLKAELAAPAGELRLLMQVAARDLVWRWLQRDWRARLSYRQLMQTRIWADGLRSDATRAFATHVCDVEQAFQAAADAEITRTLGPWAGAAITTIAKAARTLRPKPLQRQLARIVFVDRLESILDDIGSRPYWQSVQGLRRDGGGGG